MSLSIVWTVNNDADELPQGIREQQHAGYHQQRAGRCPHREPDGGQSRLILRQLVEDGVVHGGGPSHLEQGDFMTQSFNKYLREVLGLVLRNVSTM